MEQNKQDKVAALPKMLQITMLNAQAFEGAMNKGYIVIAEDGEHLEWTLGNKTLLAYFCGKMWCGDIGVYSARKKCMLWQCGKGAFPADALKHVFNTNVLATSRCRRKNMPLPQHFELIDNLFVTS